MADEILTPTLTATPQAAPATPPSTPAPDTVTMTRAEYDAALEQRANTAAAAARREAEGRRQPTPPSTTKPEPTTASNVADVAGLIAAAVAKESAFNDAAQELGLSSAQKGFLRRLAANENHITDGPAMAAWVKEQAPVFGKTATQPASTSSSPAAPATTPSVPAPVPSSPPSTSVPLERDVDILSMNAEQVHDLMRKKGGDPSNPYHPRNRAARREIRRETEAALRTRRIRLGSA